MTTATKRLSAAEAYAGEQGRAARLLKEIEEHLRSHATNADRDPRNWAYVGDLQHYNGLLAEILDPGS